MGDIQKWQGVKLVALVLALCIGGPLATGCASSPKKIRAAYVSPLKYKDYDCDQIALEMDYIGRRTTELYHSLQKDANADKWQMGVGLILFWPTLFLLEGGDGPEAAEYAQLKGEYEALRQAAIEKRCSMESLPPSPEEVLKSTEKDSGKDKDIDQTGAGEDNSQSESAEKPEDLSAVNSDGTRAR